MQLRHVVFFWYVIIHTPSKYAVAVGYGGACSQNSDCSSNICKGSICCRSDYATGCRECLDAVLSSNDGKCKDAGCEANYYAYLSKSVQLEKQAHKDQFEVVRASKKQMVKRVMMILNAKVEHVVQNVVEQKDNRQAVLYATLMVIVPPVVPGIS